MLEQFVRFTAIMFARDLIGNDSTVYCLFHTPAVRKNRVDSIISQIENISSVTSEMSGAAMCPYSPRANVTALLARGPTGGLFTGAPTDFSGADPAICRTLASPNLRTHQYDSRWVVFPILYDICRNLNVATVSSTSVAAFRWLNDPQFVGSFETEDHVYFLFRESAVEYINCGKVTRFNDRSTESLHNDLESSIFYG